MLPLSVYVHGLRRLQGLPELWLLLRFRPMQNSLEMNDGPFRSPPMVMACCLRKRIVDHECTLATPFPEINTHNPVVFAKLGTEAHSIPSQTLRISFPICVSRRFAYA
jgi:hypothetical protein